MQTLGPTPAHSLHCNMTLRGCALFKLETVCFTCSPHCQLVHALCRYR